MFLHLSVSHSVHRGDVCASSGGGMVHDSGGVHGPGGVCLVRGGCLVPGGVHGPRGGPQVNKFEQVSSDGHKMSLVWGQGQRGEAGGFDFCGGRGPINSPQLRRRAVIILYVH